MFFWDIIARCSVTHNLSFSDQILASLPITIHVAILLCFAWMNSFVFLGVYKVNVCIDHCFFALCAVLYSDCYRPLYGPCSACRSKYFGRCDLHGSINILNLFSLHTRANSMACSNDLLGDQNLKLLRQECYISHQKKVAYEFWQVVCSNPSFYLISGHVDTPFLQFINHLVNQLAAHLFLKITCQLEKRIKISSAYSFLKGVELELQGYLSAVVGRLVLLLSFYPLSSANYLAYHFFTCVLTNRVSATWIYRVGII